LVDFIRETRFERLGVFPYSEEEGTISARTLPDDVPQEEKERRAERLMAVQSGITMEKNLALVGSVLRVIADSREGEYMVCRTQWDSPEVDQCVFIPADDALSPGDMCDVRIEKADLYELFGKIVCE
jgi:ribosomal protein S12 methylthiotransferase